MTDVNISVTTGVGADTIVSVDHGNINFGIYNQIVLKGALMKGLFRFDLSGLPAGATCTAATLKLYALGSETSITYNLYKISDANGDWVEGTKSTATAGTGEPCWNKKAYNTIDWAGSVGLGTAGTDYVNTVIASVTAASAGAGSEIFLGFNAAGLAVLESWFGAATNNGFLLITSGQSTAYEMASGEHATVGYRPVLSLSYELPTDELTAADFTLSAVTFDAPVLSATSSSDDLVGKDFTLLPVTFDAPVLTAIVVTPTERIYTVDAENREYTIPAENREYAIDSDMRGVKIDIDSITKFRNLISYAGLTGNDLALAQMLFDNPELVEAITGFDFSKLSYTDYVTSLSSTGCTVEDLGVCSDDTNHIWGLHYGDAGKPCIFLTGCVQGVEYTNANILTRFMTYVASSTSATFQKLRDKFQFYAIPIINPYGYLTPGGNVLNADGVNVLYDFSDFTTVEAVAVRDKALEYKPVFFIDCHSASATGYMYFLKREDADFWAAALVNVVRIVSGVTGSNMVTSEKIPTNWAFSQISGLCRNTTVAITEPNSNNTATVMSWAVMNFLTQTFSTFADQIDADLLPANISYVTMIGSTDHANTNYGIYTGMICGKQATENWRGLLRFDISGIPSGSTITDAAIYLTATAASDNTSRNVGLHRCLTEWYEGTFTGVPSAGVDASTWNLRNANGSVVWGTGAGTPGGLAGTDYEATAAVVTPVTGVGLYSFDVTDEIQAFVDGADNYGWFVINADEATANTSKSFASNNATTGKPYMVIHYT